MILSRAHIPNLPVRSTALRAATALVAVMAAGASFAESERRWAGHYTGAQDSVVSIHAPTVPDARATVTFKNTTVHSADETFSLIWDEVRVEVMFTWQADGHAERITVFPPAGYIARPPEVTVPEDASGEIHIFKYEGF